ncbi:MAG: hypothetical protein Ct9H300mP23_06770 [Nitrospinota bacterium]|nr:MAG: hypothetical protein Ct9H300mP23_06770 [Nitrospinota bacterium]
MSLETLRPSPAFKDVLPVEYKDLVEQALTITVKEMAANKL